MMTPIQLEQIRERLQAKLTELQQCIRDLKREAGSSVQTQEPLDLEEEATLLEVVSKEHSVLANELNLLAVVQTALKRLDEGTYGICIACGRPIPEKRLQALPWVLLCVQDQEQLEARHIPSLALRHH